jgi:4-hydroxy 2-oxovalerate aldolase
MSLDIKILDCTLRDGGYVNNWEFSTESTSEIIKSLIDSEIEIVECGFVSQKKGRDKNSTQFKEVHQVNELLRSMRVEKEDTNFCVMINKGEYDLDSLPEFVQEKDMISIIRYAFHKKDWRNAMEDIDIMIEKGYNVCVQAMVTLSYTDLEILQVLEEINKRDIYAMYIVDSFGAMSGDDFRRLHYLFENNLKRSIRLGYHSHNNLQLAYSNAIDFIQIKDINRVIIIDSSIHGMGRGAGNLTTELLADYLNKKKHAGYEIVPMLEMIDKYLETIYKENYWGYSIAHFLSASFGCHPNYATFLLDTKTLSIVDMQKILTLLDFSERKNFSASRIEELYINHKSVSDYNINFEAFHISNEEVLIIAPGPNSENQKGRVIKYIEDKKPTIIAVNHIPKSYKSNYYFFSNQKRFDRCKSNLVDKDVIITSNIKVDSNINSYKIVDYRNLVVMTTNNNDNVTILLLNLLTKQSVNNVHIAGFDGYRFDTENYSYQEYDRIIEKKILLKQNEDIAMSLSQVRKVLSISFLTESLFESVN